MEKKKNYQYLLTIYQFLREYSKTEINWRHLCVFGFIHNILYGKKKPLEKYSRVDSNGDRWIYLTHDFILQNVPALNISSREQLGRGIISKLIEGGFLKRFTEIMANNKKRNTYQIPDEVRIYIKDKIKKTTKMKYARYLQINQTAYDHVLPKDVDGADLMILSLITLKYMNDKNDEEIDGSRYWKLSNKKILNDLPTLGIENRNALNKRLLKLQSAKLIYRKLYKNDAVLGLTELGRKIYLTKEKDKISEDKNREKLDAHNRDSELDAVKKDRDFYKEGAIKNISIESSNNKSLPLTQEKSNMNDNNSEIVVTEDQEFQPPDSTVDLKTEFISFLKEYVDELDQSTREIVSWDLSDSAKQISIYKKIKKMNGLKLKLLNACPNFSNYSSMSWENCYEEIYGKPSGNRYLTVSLTDFKYEEKIFCADFEKSFKDCIAFDNRIEGVLFSLGSEVDPLEIKTIWDSLDIAPHVKKEKILARLIKERKDIFDNDNGSSSEQPSRSKVGTPEQS